MSGEPSNFADGSKICTCDLSLSLSSLKVSTKGERKGVFIFKSASERQKKKGI
jgi:hypothetical protein